MKKLVVLLTCLVLAVGFLSNTTSADADPNLVGHWTFDDSTASDSSGYGNDGTLITGDLDAGTSIAIVYDGVRDSNVLDCNNPASDPEGGAASYVNCGNGSSLDITDELTMATWFQGESVYWCETVLMTKAWTYGLLTYGCDGDSSGMTTIIDYPDHYPYWNANTYDVVGTGWHHYAVTYDSATGDQTAYINGDLVNTANYAGALPDPIAVVTDDFGIGRGELVNVYKGWDGQIDDVRLYDRLVSQAEIRELAENYKAYDPNPLIGAGPLLGTLASVSWTASLSAVDHRVYMGTSQALVDAGDASVDKGIVGGTSYSGAPMGALPSGTIYWRIDTNDGSSEIQGDTWNFVIAPPPPDPNLKGRWTFDDGTADDVSGWFNHGTLYQGPTDSNTSATIVYDAVRGSNVVDLENVEAYNGYDQAYVDCGSKPSLDITLQITQMGFFKVESFTMFEQQLLTKGWEYGILRWGTTCGITCIYNDLAQYWMNPQSACMDDGNWHHIVSNYDSVTGARQIFIDGDLSVADVTASPPGTPLGTTGNSFLIGGATVSNTNRNFDGQIDDVRLYDVIVPQSQIREIAGNYKAYDPDPLDTEIDVTTAIADVSWTASLSATGLRVYMGTSQALVDSRDASVDKGTVTVADSNYTGAPIGSLALATDYYWAVDTTTAGGPAAGDTWVFTTKSGEASGPDPFDGAKYVSNVKQLSWIAGEQCDQAKVYVGTDLVLVTNRNASVLETTIDSPNPWVANPTLAVGTVYYWAVDCNASGTVYPGSEWTFETMPVPYDPNLRGYWPLDEKVGGSSFTWDTSGNENHGTFFDGEAMSSIDIVVDPVRGNVLDINNPADADIGAFLNCGHDSSLDVTNELTLMTWMKTRQIDFCEQIVLTKDWKYGLLTYGCGTGMTSILWGLSPYWTDPATQTVADGQWHHIALTYNAQTGWRYMYRDFVQETSNPAGVTLPAPLQTTIVDFGIGGRANGSATRRWNGWLDDVVILDREIDTGWEIRAYVAGCGTCVGDLDANSVVDLDDLNRLIGDLTMAKINTGQWLINPGDAEWNGCSDMDVDGDIDLQDLNRMVGNLTWRKIFFGQWQYPCGAFNP